MNHRLREALRGIGERLLNVTTRIQAWELERAQLDLPRLVRHKMADQLARAIGERFEPVVRDEIEHVDYTLSLFILTPSEMHELMMKAYAAGYTDRPLQPMLVTEPRP